MIRHMIGYGAFVTAGWYASEYLSRHRYLLMVVAIIGTVGFVIEALEKLNDRRSRCRRPVLIAGPSGVGKDAILTRFLEQQEKMTLHLPTRFGKVVMHTTRAPRPGEIDGVHYHFTDQLRMKKAIDAGEFVEYAWVHGNCYGLSRAALRQTKGVIPVAILDITGVRSVIDAGLDPVIVLVSVDKFGSVDEQLSVLRKRLIARGDTKVQIEARLVTARTELENAKSIKWDVVLDNSGDLDAAAIILGAELRTINAKQH